MYDLDLELSVRAPMIALSDAFRVLLPSTNCGLVAGANGMVLVADCAILDIDCR